MPQFVDRSLNDRRPGPKDLESNVLQDYLYQHNIQIHIDWRIIIHSTHSRVLFNFYSRYPSHDNDPIGSHTARPNHDVIIIPNHQREPLHPAYRVSARIGQSIRNRPNRTLRPHHPLRKPLSSAPGCARLLAHLWALQRARGASTTSDVRSKRHHGFYLSSGLNARLQKWRQACNAERGQTALDSRDSEEED